MKNRYYLLLCALSCVLSLQSKATVAGSLSIPAAASRVLAPPTVAYTYNHITCRGANDGGILVSATGAAPFQYSLNGGASYQTANSFTNLAPGSYTVTVKDANGETNSAGPVVLTEPPVVTPVVGNDNGGATCRNTPLVINGATLLANDSEPTGGRLKIQSVTQAANGTVTENADGTLTYTPNPGFSGTDTFTYTVKKDDGTLAFSGNGHYYEFVQIPAITWTNARNAAADRTYNGLRGYLVTITSAAENEFVKAKLLGHGWMGASDAQQEGVWKWVTGPEAGTVFSNQNLTGDCQATTGQSVNGQYVNWKNNDPNNCHGGEHYGHLLDSGLWNDFRNNDPNIKGYIVEYGGLETCSPVLTATATVTVQVKAGPAFTASVANASCAGGNTGSITVNVTSGAGANTFALNNGAFTSNNVFSGLSAGTYTIKVKGADNCVAAEQTVTVGTNADTTPPTITAPAPVAVATAAGRCDASGVALGTPVTTDNCSAVTLTNNAPAVFPLGPTTVTWTARDAAGNTATATQVVTVQDRVAPVARAQNLTVQLSAEGTATITAAQINNGSTDDCSGIKTLALSKTSFTCADKGANTVTLTVTDNSNNVATATATVTVEDKTLPVARTKNIQVNLGPSGTATIAPAEVDNGSSDGCGAVTLALDKTSFNVTNVGPNIVRLTVTDAAGNAASAQATVTVVQQVLTAVKDPAAAGASLKGYPNPFTGAATVEFTLDKSQEYALDLYDSNGRHIRQLSAGKAEGRKTNKVQVQAGQLPGGIYLMRLTTPGKVHHLRLVLQK